jgi:lysophospholipase L1-like esterase
MSGAPSRRTRWLFAATVALATLAAAEGAGRVGYALLDRARADRFPPNPFLKPYEMPDPARPDNWRPRPGFRMTLAEARAQSERDGLVLTQQTLARGAARLGVADDAIIFEISEDGYKGPPLDRSGRRPRVVAIGDSCTFGSLFDHYAWPRSAERELARLGLDAEVVNAGVNGYAPRNVLARLPELRALAARVAVLSIGWNALYADREAMIGHPFALERLAGAIAGTLATRGKSARELALAAYARPKHPDPDAQAVQRLADYRPAFLGDVETLARAFASDGTQVVLTTLPGLYVAGEAPSARAIEIGHLPETTDNPAVVAALAAGANEGIRELAPRVGATLVDLDAWSRTALVPRDAWFVDSVHLTEEGQERVGVRIGRAIAPLLAAR